MGAGRGSEVGSMGVEILGVRAEDGHQVPSSDDQESVGAFAADGTDPVRARIVLPVLSCAVKRPAHIR